MKNKLEQRVAKLEKELREVKEELGKRKYTGLKVGDTFELIEKKWKILAKNCINCMMRFFIRGILVINTTHSSE